MREERQDPSEKSQRKPPSFRPEELGQSRNLQGGKLRAEQLPFARLVLSFTMSGISLDAKGVVISCGRCGQRNRLAYHRLECSNRCGRCKADLMPPAAPLEVASESHLNAIIHSSSLPVLADFWAPWCGPCKMLAPELHHIAAANIGEVLVVKVNTEELQIAAQLHQISSLPTLVLFINGREAGRLSGARPASTIQDWLEAEMMGAGDVMRET